MSHVRVVCPACKKTLGVPSAVAGKRIRCPKCADVLPVPVDAPLLVPPAALQDPPKATGAAKVRTPPRAAEAAPPAPAPEADNSKKSKEKKKRKPMGKGAKIGLAAGGGVFALLLVVGLLFATGLLGGGNKTGPASLPKGNFKPPEETPVSFTIKSYPEVGKKCDITVVQLQEEEERITDPKGNLLKAADKGAFVPGKDGDQKKASTQTWQHSTLTTLEEGDPGPKSYSKTYHEAGIHQKGKTSPLHFHGKTVKFQFSPERKEYDIVPEGKVINVANLLECEKILTPYMLQALLPKSPVRVGETWTPELQPILDALQDKDRYKLVVDKCKGQGKYVGETEVEGKACAELEWELHLVLEPTAQGEQPGKLIEPLTMDVTYTLCAPPDGSSTLAKIKTKTAFRVKTGLDKNGDAIMDAQGFLESQMERSAEGESLTFKPPAPPTEKKAEQTSYAPNDGITHQHDTALGRLQMTPVRRHLVLDPQITQMNADKNHPGP